MKRKQATGLYGRIRQILETARSGVARTVKTTQVVANWLIGREIVEEEQRGRKKAGYGVALLEDLADKLAAEFGAGCSATNLRWFRQFYLGYSGLFAKSICHALRDESPPALVLLGIFQRSASEILAARSTSSQPLLDALRHLAAGVNLLVAFISLDGLGPQLHGSG